MENFSIIIPARLASTRFPKKIIYDVSNSKMWRNGKHYEHWAGQDLTSELMNAPHNANVFDKFQIVGKLKV